MPDPLNYEPKQQRGKPPFGTGWFPIALIAVGIVLLVIAFVIRFGMSNPL